MEPYENTYNTLKKIYGEKVLSDMDVYLVGGICAAIYASIDLYRQNEDIDLMVNIKNLDELVDLLEKDGYDVKDKRGILTENYINEDGTFIPMDHELNADTNRKNLLGIGIFLFERKDGIVVMSSYAYDEREKNYTEIQTAMPEELFDMMYDNNKVEYKGLQVKCQSKEYTYLTKSNGQREKDKIDVDVLSQYIGKEEYEKIKKIQLLQKRVNKYMILRDKDGHILSSRKIPDFEDRVENIVSQIVSSNEGKSSKEIKKILLDNERVRKSAQQDVDIRNILEIIQNIQLDGDIPLMVRQITHDYLYSDELRNVDSQEVGKGVAEELAQVSEIDETNKTLGTHLRENVIERGENTDE